MRPPLPTATVELKPILDELSRIAQARNAMGAHFKTISLEMLDADRGRDSQVTKSSLSSTLLYIPNTGGRRTTSRVATGATAAIHGGYIHSRNRGDRARYGTSAAVTASNPFGGNIRRSSAAVAPAVAERRTEPTEKPIPRAQRLCPPQSASGAEVSDACASVVDDFGDLGIDAIFYNPVDRTLYLIQSKLKVSEDFSQDEANGFCQGVRKLVACDFQGFNGNITNRTAEIESILDICERIQLVVGHLGDVLKQYPAKAIADLMADNAHGEERFVHPVMDACSSEILTALLSVNAHDHVNCTLLLSDWAGVSEPP